MKPIRLILYKGMRPTDANRREYIDAASGGLWTVNVGYTRKIIAKAV